MDKLVLWAKKATHLGLLGLLGLLSTFPIVIQGQTNGGQNDGTQSQSPDTAPPVVNDCFKAVPILTGYTTYFTRVTGGLDQNSPTFYPVLLLPVGDKWLVESRGDFSLAYAEQANGSYTRTWGYGMNYAQVDYIANRYVTVVAGRFITPFGMYGERLNPN